MASFVYKKNCVINVCMTVFSLRNFMYTFACTLYVQPQTIWFLGRKKQRTDQQKKQPSSAPSRPMPDVTDSQAMQAYFLQEVQTGEAKLALGMEDAGVEHLVNAVSVCGQPHQLLQVLQQTLPAPIFQKLIAALPTGVSLYRCSGSKY